MEILFLGSGSAFCTDNYQSNILIRYKGKNLLVDAGGDIRWSLKKQELTYKDIGAVYVSHLHADHTGGIEYLAFCSHFDPTCQMIKFYSEFNLVHDGWEKTFRGGLEGIEGQDATLDTYFDVRPVKKNDSFSWQDIQFDIVQTMHVSAKYSIVDSFGLMFNDPGTGKRIYLTTDCQFAPETSMKAYYREADYIFHDAETSPYKSGVHSHFEDLCTLDPSIKSKMRLYHFQDNVLQDWDGWQKKVKKAGFLGFVLPGDVFGYGANYVDGSLAPQASPETSELILT